MMKRVVLFLLTNLMVMATVSIVSSLLGLHSYLTAQGINYNALLVFCLLWGSMGAFISLMMSKFMAKRMMGLHIISPDQIGGAERQLLDLVSRLALQAGLPETPEVGIYESPELNAFATGPSKRNALIAVSTGLLQNMQADEVEGVLGHEISHIANGDMVTMTLIQGVINAFAMFLSRIIAYSIAMAISRGDDSSRGMSQLLFYVLAFVFDLLFTFLGSFVTAAFSRWREFRADLGGAKLAGRNKMIAALERLKANVEVEDPRAPSMASLKISHHKGIFALLSTHPPLEERIARLKREGTG